LTQTTFSSSTNHDLSDENRLLIDEVFTIEWPLGEDPGGLFHAVQVCVRTVDFRGLPTKLLRLATFIFLLGYYTLATIKDLLWQAGQR
jgi:hypothetical protein